MESGIYEIVDPFGRVYVGSTMNLGERWAQHQRLLQRGEHHARRLQRAWNLLGGKGFTFRVVEHVPPEALAEAEMRRHNEVRPYFNPDALAVRGGRPRLYEDRMEKLSVRVPQATIDALESLAPLGKDVRVVLQELAHCIDRGEPYDPRASYPDVEAQPIQPRRRRALARPV